MKLKLICVNHLEHYLANGRLFLLSLIFFKLRDKIKELESNVKKGVTLQMALVLPQES
jgi:hypothetical protein